MNRKKLKPSSGLAGLVLALHSCDAPVSLYGFRHNATAFHYFDKLPPKVNAPIPPSDVWLTKG